MAFVFALPGSPTVRVLTDAPPVFLQVGKDEGVGCARVTSELSDRVQHRADGFLQRAKNEAVSWFLISLSIWRTVCGRLLLDGSRIYTRPGKPRRFPRCRFHPSSTDLHTISVVKGGSARRMAIQLRQARIPCARLDPVNTVQMRSLSVVPIPVNKRRRSVRGREICYPQSAHRSLPKSLGVEGASLVRVYFEPCCVSCPMSVRRYRCSPLDGSLCVAARLSSPVW